MYAPPPELRAEVFARLPVALHLTGRRSGWIDGNRPGTALHSFLEGPSFDRDGNLWLVDIPFGRILRVSPAGDWDVVLAYDGWPNGLAFHRDGRIFIADYRRGILATDTAGSPPVEVFGHRASESFKGCNDLVFDAQGRLYFTDQGQTGLHDPSGRVYRADLAAGRLERLLDTAPSPNGLVLDLEEAVLLVAMTRANAVWRLPLLPDGTVSKVGLSVQLSGGGGPDGLALDAEGNLFVAHFGIGCVWAFTPHGEPLWRIRCEHIGRTVTNLAFGGPEKRDLYITVSDAGAVARVTLPVRGKPTFG